MSIGRIARGLGRGDSGGGISAEITKASNGYMVTFRHSTGEDVLDMYAGMAMREDAVLPPDLDALKEESERVRPKVFVYSKLEEAWTALRAFFMDGKLPESI